MPKTTECVYCKLFQNGFVPMQRVQNPQWPILVIGQAPGSIEVITKIPFTGPAGKTLWRLMKEAGVDKQALNITNMVQCAPPGDREPTETEINQCAYHLLNEIKEIKPKLIIALGEVAMFYLTGEKGIQRKRASVFPLLEKWNYHCDVLCMLHPSFVMRQRAWIDIAIKDFKLINKYFLDGYIVKPRTEPTFIYNPSPSELAEELAKMSKDVTAIDIETPGELDMLTAKVIGIAFCSDPSISVGLDFTSGMSGEHWEIMKKFLADPKARKCTQNGQFDCGILATNNAPVKGVSYDTLLAEHTMNSDLPGNLDFLRSRYTDISSYKPTTKEMKSIGSWDPETRMKYNCLDVITTLEVMNGQLKVMSKDQIRVLETIEVPLIDVCNYMERKGIKVNVNGLAILNSRIEPKLKELETKYFNPIAINPRSPLQLKKYFGIDSTDIEAFTLMLRKHHPKSELIHAIIDYRTLSKVQGTYLIGIYNKLRGDRIHAHPKITGTGTGRLAYQDPNLQNVPKELRVIYIADDTDHCILESDYAQLELRVIGLIAPEPIMIQEFAEGKRIHSIIGKEIYGKDWDDLTPHQKIRSKTVVFGTAYGRSARSIAIEHNITIKEAEHLQSVCIKKYPGISEYLRRQEQIFFATQQCKTAFGRIRYLQTVLQSYNTPIQSAASDIALGGVIDLFRKGFDLRVTVHDSIVFNIPKKELKEQAMEIKKVMEKPIPQLNNYSFPVKQEYGDNWFQLKEVE